MGIKFRIDDVNPNTDVPDLIDQLRLLEPWADEIYLGVNLFGRTAMNGAVYPDLPLKDHRLDYFYEVDRMFDIGELQFLRSLPKVQLASHGLIHSNHEEMSPEAVAMSIVMSCGILQTEYFIPPFNKLDFMSHRLCLDKGIIVLGNDDDHEWRSLETEKFDQQHKLWYYHPWRLNADAVGQQLGSVE